jgi:integrase
LLAGLRAKRLDRVTAADLDSLYADLLASGMRQREGGLSARTMRYLHTFLRKALADAVDRDLLVRNVAGKANPPRAKDTKPPEVSWWTPAELRSFLDLTADESLGPLFRLAALTGMRRGEVCGLRWSDGDLDAARLEVRQQLTVVRTPGDPNGGLQFSDRTKTDHGRRSIDLDASTVAVLRT